MNGKKKVIGASIATSIILMVVYNALIAIGIPPPLNRPESQWIANVVAVEKWQYQKKIPKTVVIGSSMAHRLRPKLLEKEGIANLSLAGKSIFDGLEVLIRTGKIPKLVLVEINMLTRPADEDFTKALFSPVSNEIKAIVPALRDSYRPITHLQRAILLSHRLLFRNASNRRSGIRVDNHSGNTEELKHSLFESLLQQQVRAFSSLSTEGEIEKIVMTLKSRIEQIKKMGGKVVLFEMPMHPKICRSLNMKYIRSAIAKYLPIDRYKQLTRPDCKHYHTADGLHLTPVEAKYFSRNLIANINQLKII